MFSYKREVFQWLKKKKKSNVLWFYIKIWQLVVSQRLAAVWNLKPCWWVFQLRQVLGVSCTWISPLPTPVLWQHLAVAGEESGRFPFPVHVKKLICPHHPFTTGSGQSHIGRFKFSKIHFFLQAWILSCATNGVTVVSLELTASLCSFLRKWPSNIQVLIPGLSDFYSFQ